MAEDADVALFGKEREVMSGNSKCTDLELTEELFGFLQGRIPEGYQIPRKHRPKLTPDQAWTAIWYLGNQYWQVTDHIERCCVCGSLYDADDSGACLDYGKAPYHFCDNCTYSEEFTAKNRRNPDKSMRDI